MSTKPTRGRPGQASQGRRPASPRWLQAAGQVLFETISEAAFVTDAKGKIAAWNESAERLFGYGRQEVLARPPKVLIASDPHGGTWQAIQSSLRRHTAWSGSVELQAKDARRVRAQVTISPMLDAKRRLLGNIWLQRGGLTQAQQAQGRGLPTAQAQGLPPESLHVSDEKLRMLEKAVQQSIDGIAVADLNGFIQFVNHAWAQAHGYSADELPGKHLSVFHTDQQMHTDVIPFNEQVMKNGAFRSEVGHVRRDGTTFDTWMSTTLLRDEAGKPIGLVGTARDITESKRVAEQLQESQRMLQLVLDSIPARVFWKDRDSVYLGCNQLFAKDAGVNWPEEIVGKTDYDLPWKKEETDFYRTCDRRVMDTDTPEYHIVEPVLQADGRQAWVDTNKAPLHDSEGTVTGILGTYEDITERMRAEQELRESQRALSTLMSNLPGMAYRCRNDRDWTMEFVSEGCWELTGHQPPDLVHNRRTSFAQLIHPDDRESLWEEVQAALRARKPFRLVYRIRTANGDEKWVWEQGCGVFTEQGELVALEGFIADITERKKAEEALREAYDSLEERVRTRTSELRKANEALQIEIAERKRAEDALRASEEQYRCLIENANDVVYRLDSKGRFTLLNEQVTRVLGYSIQELMGQSFERVVDPRDLPAYREAFHAALRAERGSIPAFRCLAKDGREVWMSVSYAPLLDAHGGVVGTFGFARDITEHKRAEESLRESEARYRQLFATVPDAIMLFDAETLQFVDVNESALGLYGYSKEEFLKLRHPDITAQQEESTASIQQTLAGELTRIPLRYHKKRDGTVFPSEISASVLTLRNRRTLCGVIRDVTERKRAEEALQESEAKYRTLVEQIPAIVYVAALDETGTMLYVSPRIETLLGYSQADCIADPDTWQKSLHPDDRERVLAELKRCYATNEPFVSEYRMLTRTGREVWFRDEGVIVQDDMGRPLFLQGVMFDITDRKRAEEALRESEERYRALFEQAADSIVLVDAKREALVEFNQKAHENLGYTREEFQKLRIPDLEAAESADEIARHRKRVIEQESDFFETKHRTKDGDIRDTEVSTRVVSIRGRESFLCIWRDISERKRAEQALQESEELFRTVVESSKDAIIAIGSNGRVTLFNRAAETMFGWSAQEMLGQHLDRIMPPEYRRRHRNYARSFFATGQPSGAINNIIELPGMRRNGEGFEMELSLATGGAGERQIVLAVMRDVTERKRAEKALREAEHRYRQIFESTNEGMLLVAPDTKTIVDANRSAQGLLGCPLAELQGLPLARFLPAGGRPGYPLPGRAGIARGYVPTERRVVKTRGGRSIPVEADAVEMDLGGKRVMTLHILRDVSDRVELRRRLMEVQENERRRISRDIHDGVSQLLVGVGLQIDHFGRHVAQQEPLAAELSKIRALLGEATRETREICTRLRPDTLDDFGLIPSIRSYVSALAPHGPKVSISVSPGFGRLPAEVESALYRIGQEALANTLKHARAKNVTMAFEQDGRNVAMEVADDGCGFEPQRVLSVDRARRGLGLAGMAERVQLLGGRLAVESAPGQGTTLRVDLQIELNAASFEPT